MQVVLPFREMHALCPESYRQSLAAANALRKQSGKRLVNGALCYGIYASDINAEVEEASPVLRSKAQGCQYLTLSYTPMAVQCTDVHVLSLVALVPLGSGNTFIMETISAVDGTAKAESLGIKKGSVLYIKPNDPWVIPASKAGFAHLLVVPLSSHEDAFVEEDQPWIPNHYKKILDGTLLCRGDTIPCRAEAGKILQLHINMVCDPRVHCPGRSAQGISFSSGSHCVDVGGAQLVVCGFLPTAKMGWQIVGLCLSCLQKGCAVDNADLFRVCEGQVRRIWETAAAPNGIVEEWRSDLFAGAFLQFVSVPCKECACIVDPPLKELPLNTGQRRSDRLQKVELPAVKAETTAKPKGKPKQKPPPKREKTIRAGMKQERKPEGPEGKAAKGGGRTRKRGLWKTCWQKLCQ